MDEDFDLARAGDVDLPEEEEGDGVKEFEDEEEGEDVEEEESF